jgi:hypothetical protein
MSADIATAAQKSQALEAVLESPQFRRAEVLKTLLQYLAAQELSGRSSEVSEYEIATQALGRPADFSADSDSSVRTRILALRKKLEEIGPAAGFRLEIPRGSYALRYVLATETSLTELPKFRTSRWWLAVPALAVLLLAAWLLQPRSESLVGRAWGSMIEPGADVVIGVGTPASMFVRDFGNVEPPVGDPGYRLDVPDTEKFRDWYKSAQHKPLGARAFLHPNIHSPLWGDSAAAVTATRLLTQHRAHVEMIPAARTHPIALRDRNAILIGRPEYTEAVQRLLPDNGLTVAYSAEKRALGIVNRANKQWWFAQNGLRDNFGLITVLPSDAAQHFKTIVFCGINSDGADAAARFFSSQAGLAELDAAMQKAGHRTWPAAYQVVVRTKSVDNYTMDSHFEALYIVR